MRNTVHVRGCRLLRQPGAQLDNNAVKLRLGGSAAIYEHVVRLWAGFSAELESEILFSQRDLQ